MGSLTSRQKKLKRRQEKRIAWRKKMQAVRAREIKIGTVVQLNSVLWRNFPYLKLYEDYRFVVSEIEKQGSWIMAKIERIDGGEEQLQLTYPIDFLKAST